MMKSRTRKILVSNFISVRGGGVRGDPILEYIFKIFNFALCLKDPRVEGV